MIVVCLPKSYSRQELSILSVGLSAMRVSMRCSNHPHKIHRHIFLKVHLSVAIRYGDILRRHCSRMMGYWEYPVCMSDFLPFYHSFSIADYRVKIGK